MLQIESLSAGYGSIPVLRGISETFGCGESVGILGHNGMGKTTLMKCLIGLLRPSAGTIRFDGADVFRLAPNQRARLGIGYVPQGRGIFPGLTVLENLRMGLWKTGNQNPEVLMDLLDDFPRLKPLLSRAGGSLSGGEQQLLALVRALIGQPRLLLLDEPTEGIQPSIIEEIAEALIKLRSKLRLTLVLVEQNLEFIAAVSERVIVIKRGRLTEEIPQEHLGDIRLMSEYTGMVV